MTDHDASPVTQDGADVLIRVKAVPGARRDAVAGPLADRLKIRVAAPPEGGKANKAIAALLARALGTKPSAVRIERGHACPEKTLRVRDADAASVRRALGLP